ncbi:hypothetical protein EIN_182020, partial [Entamoeba invadens IP1]|uniref:hypothetical protein n=1 Tax=Entamoeba invadens IP1 TaxID=370355 RepID=UPI0002C3DE91
LKYLTVYFWQKSLIKMYTPPKVLLQETIKFVVIFLTSFLLHQQGLTEYIYYVLLIFYTLLFMDDNYWHELPNFFSRAKLD